MISDDGGLTIDTSDIFEPAGATTISSFGGSNSTSIESADFDADGYEDIAFIKAVDTNAPQSIIIRWG